MSEKAGYIYYIVMGVMDMSTGQQGSIKIQLSDRKQYEEIDKSIQKKESVIVFKKPEDGKHMMINVEKYAYVTTESLYHGSIAVPKGAGVHLLDAEGQLLKQ